MLLYVLLGDVVRSREVTDREEFRRRLDRACVAVSEQYEDDVYADAKVLKGIDEVAAVLTSLRSAYDIVREFSDRLHPQPIRFALVRGEIDVGLTEGDVATMDGPAFHRADELLERVERTDLLFDLDVNEPACEKAIADVINLLLARKRERTDRQREIIELYERYGTQRGVAEELDISQQAVSRALERAHWPVTSAIEERLQRTLERGEREW